MSWGNESEVPLFYNVQFDPKMWYGFGQQEKEQNINESIAIARQKAKEEFMKSRKNDGDLTEDELDDLNFKRLNVAADIMSEYDPDKAQEWLNKADQIKSNKEQRLFNAQQKNEQLAQQQKNDALIELANLDTESPNIANEWSDVRKKWISLNPNIASYLPENPQYIDAKGNYGTLAKRGYADQLMRQAQSEKYLANSSLTTDERENHLATAAAYEKKAKEYGFDALSSESNNTLSIKEMLDNYNGKVIPDSKKVGLTKNEQDLIDKHNADVYEAQLRNQRLAEGNVKISDDLFNSEVNKTLGPSATKAQQFLDELKNSALSIISSVKNGNTVSAAYQAAKKSLGDALSNADYQNMAGFDVKEGVLGRIKSSLGASSLSEDQSIRLVNSFLGYINSAINAYNRNIEEKTKNSKLNKEINNRFFVSNVPSGITELTGNKNKIVGNLKPEVGMVPKAKEESANRKGATEVKFIGGKWRGRVNGAWVEL